MAVIYFMVLAPGAIVQLVEQPVNYTKFKGLYLAAAGRSWPQLAAAAGRSWPQLKVAERQ